MHAKTITILLLQAALGLACAHEKWIRSELYFGSSRGADKSPVSQGEWTRFVREEIATRFPDGFTVVAAHGHWKAEDEESHLVIVVHGTDDSTAAQKLEELRELYKKRFAQSSVLRVDQSAAVEF